MTGRVRRRRWWVDNRNAAMLAVAAAVLFGLGYVGPFMTITKLGLVQTYSLVGGIAALAADGKAVLAGVVFVFSVVLPVAKLGLLLVSTSRLVAVSGAARRWMHAVAERTARFSMVDVVVVALLIVVVKMEGLAEVHPGWGTACFMAGALVSMAAGLCVDVEAV